MNNTRLRRVLVVDDDEPKRYSVVRRLHQAGYAILEADSARRALDILETEKLDVVVLDVHLPDMDGFELCQRIKNNPMTSSVRVLHCSATFTTSTDRTRGLDTGADAYLIVPFEPQELIAQVNALVRVRQAEEAQAFLASVVECSEDAIVSKDLNGVVLTWNKGAERLFGYTAAEMVGSSITRIFPEELKHEEAVILEKLKKRESIRLYETVRVAKDGRRIDVALTVSPICDDRQVLIGASKIIRDITERKKMERELQEANASLVQKVQERTLRLQETLGELQAFSYSLSHDLRAPLRTIHTFAEIIESDHGEKLGPDGNALLKKVSAAAERIERLITDVLSFTRMSQGELELRPVDADALVKKIIMDNPDFHSPKADIEVAPLPRVIADEVSLTQCFTNLLGNAVKYVPTGVKAQVRVSSEKARNGSARLLVQDNGLGIPPEVHLKIFDLFYRYHGKPYEGTGLGLAIVRKAAERMGGRVGLESDVGKGSRFWIELPVAT